MTRQNGVVAGVLFLIAGTQFALGFVIAEALYPGYSVPINYVSDLGVGPSSMIFNSSIFLLGLLSLVGAYFLPRTRDFRVLTALLVLMAVGTMGIGIFTKAYAIYVHGTMVSVAFFFASLSAIASFKVLRMPLSAISVILGLITLGASALFSVGMVTSGALTSTEAPTSEFFLGIGPGGMESMIIYPVLIWLILFSGHLIEFVEKPESAS